MATAFDTSAEIARPVDEVWEHLVDWDQAPDWMRGIDSMRADGPTEVGTTLVFHTRGKDRESTITALNPGRSITLTSVQGGVRADYEYSCTPSVEATTLRLTAECTTNSLPWRLIAPLLRMAVRRTDGGQPEALRRLIEASGPEPSGPPDISS